MTPPVPTLAPITPLTPALQRIAQHLTGGLTPPEIATQTGLSAETVRGYIRDIRRSVHCPPRCKQPVTVHRLITTQQVPPPTAHRPVPNLSPEQLLLLHAVAEHTDTCDIAIAAQLAPADLRATLGQLLASTGAHDTTQLVILAHGWNLLTAAPPHSGARK